MERNDSAGGHTGVELLDLLDTSVHRFTTLVAGLDPGRPVPGSDWTIGDTVAHVATGADAYATYLEGDTTPAVDVSDAAGGSIAASNARRLADDPERDLTALTSLLRRRIDDVIARSQTLQLDDAVSWHGRPAPLRAYLASAVAEVLMHGRDIAVAVDRPWPLSRRDATTMIGGLAPLLPVLVDPVATRDLQAVVRLRVRGGPELALRFDRGTLAVGPCDERRPDVTVLADPTSFLLVAYGRASQWPAIATGKLVAWGRRPWLAVKLTSYLVRP